LDHLGKLAKRFRCALHAYVLMTNHFHLLLSSDLPNGASLLMKFLGRRYVKYVSRAYKRSASLWEGRFRSSLVQTQHYVLGCYRLYAATRSMAAICRPSPLRASSRS
jgi:putative transposase